jgi:hypothetical protein
MRTMLAVTAAAILLIAWALVHFTPRRTPSPAPETTRDTIARRPRLPAPRLPVTPLPADADVENRSMTNLFARLKKGAHPG